MSVCLYIYCAHKKACKITNNSTYYEKTLYTHKNIHNSIYVHIRDISVYNLTRDTTHDMFI